MKPHINPDDYKNALPFPFAVIDDFLPKEVAEAAFMAFPSPSDPAWAKYGREYLNAGNGRKFEMANRDGMPDQIKKVIDIVHGSTFREILSKLTGFEDLIHDETLTGGGLNLAQGGGFLRVHADFNYSNLLEAYRTINVLVYFSKDWKEEYGGTLELWSRDLSRCEKKILPKFNRAVIFTTFSDAYHGVSPVSAPGNLVRQSMNFYFYRKTPTPGIKSEPHKTLWQESVPVE